MTVTMQATEAAEDAELLTTTVPAPQSPQLASGPAVAIVGQAFTIPSQQVSCSTADLENQAQSSTGDGSKPETWQSFSSGNAQGNVEPVTAADDINIATGSQAVSDDASVQREADSNGAGVRDRAKWGQVQQPFTAAGQATSSSNNATAAVLLGSTQTAQPTAVAEGGSASSKVPAEVPRTALDTAEESVHQSSAAESSTAVSPSGQVPVRQTSDLEQEASAELSHTEQSATAVEASDLTLPEIAAPQEPPAATDAAGSPHTAATAESRPPTAAATATAAGLSAITTVAAARPAAGFYRRVAWAPAQNPFPAAGQLRAVPQQPIPSVFEETLQSAAVVEQPLLPAPQTVDHGAILKQPVISDPQTVHQSQPLVQQPLPSALVVGTSAQVIQTQQEGAQVEMFIL